MWMTCRHSQSCEYKTATQLGSSEVIDCREFICAQAIYRKLGSSTVQINAPRDSTAIRIATNSSVSRPRNTT